jgi:hypothetical protein
MRETVTQAKHANPKASWGAKFPIFPPLTNGDK